MSSRQIRLDVTTATVFVVTALGASAAVVHQWDFDDAFGTALGDAAASVGGSWQGAVPATELATDGSGNLSFGSTTNTVDAHLGLGSSATGSWLVRVDYSSWDVGAVDGDEQASFYLEGAGNVRMEMLRFFDATWELSAWSPPDIGSVKQFATAVATPVATVLELDQAQLRYRVWWGDGTIDGWTSTAWSDANPALVATTLRFRKGGDFTQPGDTVKIDRIVVADQLGDVVDLPPYPENLVAGWVDGSDTGTSTAPGVALAIDVAAGGAAFDLAFNCNDRFYGPDGDAAYSTGPHDVQVAAVTLQSNQYALITISNQFTGTVRLDELRFDWGARFDGSPRFFYLTYEDGDLAGVTPGSLLWSVTTYPESPVAGADVDNYNDAAVDLTTLADRDLEVGEYAVFRLQVDGFGDAGKSLLDNLGFFGSLPPPVVSEIVAATVQVPAGEVILLDMGTDRSYRGASVVNPDENGNYWNSVDSWVYWPDLLDVNGDPTAVAFGFGAAAGGTDSYNGPAGGHPTAPSNCVFSPAALGYLGATNAVYDFYDHTTFTIQGLDPERRYDLTFFGSHKYDTPGVSTFTVYTSNDYAVAVVSNVLANNNESINGFEWEHNEDEVCSIKGIQPQFGNSIWIGVDGYVNCMQVEATEPADAAIITWEAKAGTEYAVEEATNLTASNWTGVVTGLVGTGSGMSATVVVSGVSAALRVVEKVVPPARTLFEDDFENGATGWTFGIDGDPDTAWEIGTPVPPGPSGASSPTNCWGTNMGADYDYGAECWLRSPPIDLTSVTAATLKWAQAVDIENEFQGTLYDWGEINILDVNNAVLIGELGGKVHGEEDTPAWGFRKESLAAAVGNVVKVEFRFTSDTQYFIRRGWYIDDVKVTEE